MLALERIRLGVFARDHEPRQLASAGKCSPSHREDSGDNHRDSRQTEALPQ
jgi:hypothetical protein